ncbi:MAG: MarR family transcriptional regulator [Rubrobacter sp.]|nr:MarR family transcriptional regulator [Rubrobacter sp.]
MAYRGDRRDVERVEPEGTGRDVARSDADEFWDDIGVDLDGMSPRGQAVAGAVTGGVVLLAAGLLILFTNLWWLIFVFGWLLFPALGAFSRGVAGLADSGAYKPLPGDQEWELLDALQREGELSPAQVAMETSLTVSEADEMLKELAGKGHLEVRVRGGGIFYALWGAETRGLGRGEQA